MSRIQNLQKVRIDLTSYYFIKNDHFTKKIYQTVFVIKDRRPDSFEIVRRIHGCLLYGSGEVVVSVDVDADSLRAHQRFETLNRS